MKIITSNDLVTGSEQGILVKKIAWQQDVKKKTEIFAEVGVYAHEPDSRVNTLRMFFFRG